VIEAAGGAIIYSAEVSEILLDRPRRSAIGVCMADGRELRARTIISDAGAHNTFGRLLPAAFAISAGVLEELKKHSSLDRARFACTSE